MAWKVACRITGFVEMLAPVDLADLVANQRIRSASVGHPQQRLGEAHQRDSLFGIEPVLMQKGVDPADVALARILDQLDRIGLNCRMISGENLGFAQAIGDAGRLFLAKRRAQRAAVDRFGTRNGRVVGGRVLGHHIHTRLARWTRRACISSLVVFQRAAVALPA